MPAYIIADVQVTDPEAYAGYIKLVPATVEAYGGKFVVRGGAAENLEGDWEPNRVVVLEFESVAQAKAWYNSEEYREPKGIRHGASHGKMIVVEGAS
jgi:uncharacterized protein (DUF1330 family)